MALLLPQMARLPPRLYLAPGRLQAPVRLLPQMHPAPQAAMQCPPEAAAAAGTDLPENVLDLGEGCPTSKPKCAYAPKCCVSPTGAPTNHLSLRRALQGGIGRNLERFEERGFEGLFDSTALATPRGSPRR
jgi:hypothetical protein